MPGGLLPISIRRKISLYRLSFHRGCTRRGLKQASFTYSRSRFIDAHHPQYFGNSRKHIAEALLLFLHILHHFLGFALLLILLLNICRSNQESIIAHIACRVEPQVAVKKPHRFLCEAALVFRALFCCFNNVARRDNLPCVGTNIRPPSYWQTPRGCSHIFCFTAASFTIRNFNVSSS